jgi:hypothetical protein
MYILVFTHITVELIFMQERCMSVSWTRMEKRSTTKTSHANLIDFLQAIEPFRQGYCRWRGMHFLLVLAGRFM